MRTDLALPERVDFNPEQLTSPEYRDRDVPFLAGLHRGAEFQKQVAAVAKREGVPKASVIRDVDFYLEENGGSAERKDQDAIALALVDPDPWPTAVSGQEIVDELRATINRYVVLPDHADVAVVLWILHAHAIDAFYISPTLSISSPVWGCGKTTLSDLIAATTPRSMSADNITPASVFRTVEEYRPTLILDEMDAYLNGSNDLRGVLNSSHRRSGSVVRCVGDDNVSTRFATFCATVFVKIGKLPSTLADRSITISMRRATADEQRGVEDLRLDWLEQGLLEPLRRKAWRWAQENLEVLSTVDPNLPDWLYGRRADNWRPLFAVAEALGESWLTLAVEAAAAFAGQEEIDSVRLQALEDINALFDEQATDRLSSQGVVDQLVEKEDRPWGEWSRNGGPITKIGVAKLLKPFDIKPVTIRVSATATLKGYKREDFADAVRRYLTPSQSSVHGENQGLQSRNTSVGVTDTKTGANPGSSRAVTDVTVPEPQEWRVE